MMFASERAEPAQRPRRFTEKIDLASAQHNRPGALRDFQFEEHLDRLVIPAGLPPCQRRLQREPGLEPGGGVRQSAQPFEAKCRGEGPLVIEVIGGQPVGRLTSPGRMKVPAGDQCQVISVARLLRLVEQPPRRRAILFFIRLATGGRHLPQQRLGLELHAAFFRPVFLIGIEESVFVIFENRLQEPGPLGKVALEQQLSAGVEALDELAGSGSVGGFKIDGWRYASGCGRLSFCGGHLGSSIIWESQSRQRTRRQPDECRSSQAHR